MKLRNKESFLPSTKRGEKWAEHSLSLVNSKHPLWSVEELYQAILFFGESLGSRK